MASHVDDRSLRAVNYRLKNTPVNLLPKLLPHITSQLVAFKIDLGNNPEAIWLKARIGSLLQDRTPEGRLSAVVLAKTVLDIGGSSLLQDEKDKIGSWIRSLLEILKKPGPNTLKRLTVVTIVKAFTLTWENATLVRELTTPALPSFITICLQHFQTASSIKSLGQVELLEFILGAFAQLLPRHPTIFRTYSNQIRGLTLAVIYSSSTASGSPLVLDLAVKTAASKVYVLLHQTAQKGSGALEWENAFNQLLLNLHTTTDHIYRAVVEDWQSVAGIRSTLGTAEDFGVEPALEGDAQLNLPAWSGLNAGVEHLRSGLLLLEKHLSFKTASIVKIPLGKLMDLVARLIEVQVPDPRDRIGQRYNPQAGREERDTLIQALPMIHVSALELVYTVLETFNSASLPLCANLINLTAWLFQNEKLHTRIRTAVYQNTAKLVSLCGPGLRKESVTSIEKIAVYCCKDLLPIDEDKKVAETLSTSLTNTSQPNKTSRSDDVTAANLSAISQSHPKLHAAALDLLPILIGRLPAHLLSRSTRTRLDQTAVAISHADAITAGVLNPAPHRASLLPLLARTAPKSRVTEAILRPRMPVVLQGKHEQPSTDPGTAEMEDEMELEEADSAHEPQREEDEISPPAASWTVPAPSPPAASAADAWNGGIGSAPGVQSEPASLAGIALPTVQSSPTETLKRGFPDTVKSFPAKKARTDGEPAEDFEQSSGHKTMEAAAIAVPANDGNITLPAQTIEEDSDDDDDDGSDFEIPKLVMKSDLADDDDEA